MPSEELYMHEAYPISARPTPSISCQCCPISLSPTAVSLTPSRQAGTCIRTPRSFLARSTFQNPMPHEPRHRWLRVSRATRKGQHSCLLSVVRSPRSRPPSGSPSTYLHHRLRVRAYVCVSVCLSFCLCSVCHGIVCVCVAEEP